MTDKTADQTQAPAASNAADTSLHILAALGDLFAGAEDHVKLPSREEDVCFYAAKMKHLGVIGGLIQGMISTLEKSELQSLLKLVSKDQEDKINAGVSPFSLETTEVVKAALGDTPLGIKLITGAAGMMSEVAPLFTSLKPGEFEELDMDEGLIVLYGVFAHNYAFFTQRLLPVIAASIANLNARKAPGK